MIKTYTEIPDIENGYLLETNKGWFGVIKPTYKQNLFPNPNFVNYPTYDPGGGPQAVGVPISEGVFAPSGLNSITNGWAYRIILTSGQYTFSAYLRSADPEGGVVRVAFGAKEKRFTLTTEYTRISITTTFVGAPASQFINFFTGGTGTSVDITAVQLERGGLTTFFSGDTINNYYEPDSAYDWTGLPYRSISVREESAYTGGELVSLHELGFQVTEVTGLGYPDLSPVTYEQSLSNSVLYSCSTIEQREIELTGIVNECSFEDLMCSLGGIGEVLYNSSRPVRIHYTPYEYCDDTIPCVMFDFLYQSGLDETVESLHGQEIDIRGITLDPCLYSCSEYTFVTTELEDMILVGNTSTAFFVHTDGTISEVTIPAFVPTLISSTITEAIECNGRIYAIIQQSDTTLPAPSFRFIFAMYDGITWVNIASVTPTLQAGWPTNMTTAIGVMADLECTDGGIYVGGYWDNATFASGPGVTNSGTADRWSMFRYDPVTNNIEHFRISDAAFLNNIGKVNAFGSDKYGHLIAAGRFAQYTSAGEAGVNVESVVVVNLETGKASGPQIPTLGQFTIAGSPGPVGPGISAKYIGAGGKYYDVLIDTTGTSNRVFLSSNANPAGLYAPFSGRDGFLTSYIYNSNADSFSNAPIGFPFSATAGFAISGYLVDMLQWGQGGNYLITGRFTQATSDTNSGGGPYTVNNNYLSNAAWINIFGYDVAGGVANTGYIDALGEPTAGLQLNYVSGLYDDPVSYLGTIVVAGDRTYARMIDLGPSILFYGNISAYGRSNNKKVVCGFVEYIPQSVTNLSQGTFVPSVLDLGLVNPTALPNYSYCWGTVALFNDVSGISMLVGTAKSSADNSEFFYNTGIQIDTCTNNRETQAEIIIDSDFGIQSVSGVKNATTGRSYYFEPRDMPANEVWTLSYNGEQIILSRQDGTVTTLESIYTNGNPFAVHHGDILQVIFSMRDTYDTNNRNNNPSFTAKYKTCYSSYPELMKCVECN